MSRSETEKVIIDFKTQPILADLDFPALLRDHHENHKKQQSAEKDAAKWKLKKQRIDEEIQNAIEVVSADSVVYAARGGKTWKATLVKGEPGSKTDEDLLKTNLMKLGKLDAGMIEVIFKASQVPVEARKSYVLVTVQGTENA